MLYEISQFDSSASVHHHYLDFETLCFLLFALFIISHIVSNGSLHVVVKRENMEPSLMRSLLEFWTLYGCEK